MSDWINYHHLYYFKIIAEEQSVSKAAARLRLGQPTLSAQLKQFEEALGFKLFDREHKKLILTEHGKVALNYSKSIFKLGSEMVEVLNDRIKPARPSLCIGALDSIPKQIILQLVEFALRLGPCQIQLVEGNADELIRELAAHRVDLLLTNFIPTAPNTKGLFHRRLTKNRVGFYGAPSFKKLRSGFPLSLKDQPVILPTYDSKLRYDLDHWSKLHSIGYEIQVESQDIAVKKLLAIGRVGLLPAAEHSVTRQILEGELIEIGQIDGIYEELHLVSADRRIQNKIAKQLMTAFKV